MDNGPDLFGDETSAPTTSTPSTASFNLGNVKTSSGDFAQPASAVDGVVLTANNLRKSYRGLTLQEIANKWAPKGDGANDPVVWVKNVGQISGITPNQVPNLDDPETLHSLIKGIGSQEKSKDDFKNFSDDIIKQGVDSSISGNHAALVTGPDLFGDPADHPTVDKTPGVIDPAAAAQLHVDLNSANPEGTWPVYDPYNHVMRNKDGSVESIGDSRNSTTVGPDGQLIIGINQYAEGRDPKTIAAWQAAHPNDISNTKFVAQGPGNGDELAGGFYQGLANVKNTVEGGVNAVLPGHPFNNDLTTNLLNRQTNDERNQDSGVYHLGKFGGEMATTAPLLAVPGLDAVEGEGLLANAARFAGGAGGEGNMLLRGTSLASRGALQGAEQSALTTAGSNDDVGHQIASGATQGAIAAPLLSGLANTKGFLGDKFGPKLPQYSTDVEDVRSLAREGMDKWKFDYTVPQIIAGAGDKGAAKLDQQLQQMSGTGFAARVAENSKQALRNIGSTFGLAPEVAEKGLTPTVMTAAKKDLGGQMNDLQSQLELSGDTWKRTVSDFGGISKDLTSSTLNTNERKAIRSVIVNLQSAGKTGTLPGKSYVDMTKDGTALSDLLQDANPNVRRYGQRIKESLDNGFTDPVPSTDPDDHWANAAQAAARDKLKQLRMQYKNMSTVSDLTPKYGSDGIAMMKHLPEAVSNNFDREAYMGAGELGSLAKQSKFFNTSDLSIPPPTLADRLKQAIPALPGASAAGLGVFTGHPVAAGIGLGSAVAGPFVRPVINGMRAKGLSSPEAVNRLLGRSLTNSPNNNYFANKFAIPAIVANNNTRN